MVSPQPVILNLDYIPSCISEGCTHVCCHMEATVHLKQYKYPDVALNSLWPIDATCCHGSGNGLVPDDSKPLSGPKLTYQQYDLQLQE